MRDTLQGTGSQPAARNPTGSCALSVDDAIANVGETPGVSACPALTWVEPSTKTSLFTYPNDVGLVPEKPLKASLSRRGALALVFGGSALIGLITVGQTIGLLRPLAFLLPRGRNSPAEALATLSKPPIAFYFSPADVIRSYRFHQWARIRRVATPIVAAVSGTDANLTLGSLGAKTPVSV